MSVDLGNGLVGVRVSELPAASSIVDSDDIIILQGGVLKIISKLNLGVSILPGGPISSLPAIGFDPGTDITVAEWIQNVFYQSQPPLGVFSGGTVNELTAATTVAINLIWDAIRQAATVNLSSIVITGNSSTLPQTFVNPAAPGNVSGSQSVTAPTNVNTTYTLTIVTSDGKTASFTTTQSYKPKRYWGTCTSTSPDASEIVAADGGGSELSNSIAKNNIAVIVSTDSNVFYSYPATEPDLTSILVGGFESIAAFTQVIVSVTNASGYVQDYKVYVTNNQFYVDTPTIVAS